jgi:signal transduction histidine kinase
MPNDGKINVTCTNYTDFTYKESIKISVHDEGEGIPGDIIDKIFNPFFTTKQKGTGLGLHIVKNILEAHQGSISVESKPHAGTTFTILLPGVTNIDRQKTFANDSHNLPEQSIPLPDNDSTRIALLPVFDTGR